MLNLFLIFSVFLMFFFLDHNSIKINAIFLFLIVFSSMFDFFRKRRKFNKFCFEFFFFPTFLISTFLYPIFYYGKIPHPMFRDLSPYWIVESLYIATFGFLFYILGSEFFYLRQRKNLKPIDGFRIVNLNHKIFNFATSLSFIIFLVLGGASMILRYSAEISNERAFVFLYIYFYVKIFLFISSVAEFFRLRNVEIKNHISLFKKINKHYLLNFVIITVFLLVAADRGEFVFHILTAVFLYNYFIKRINIKRILTISIFGLFFLSALTSVRLEEGGLTDISNFENAFSLDIPDLIGDFFASSVDIYTLVEYTSENGSMAGKNIISPVLSIIPFLQTFVAELLNINFNDYPLSSELATDIINGGRSGMGTNMIGDLYYSFGFIGTLISMFIFGFLVSYLYQKIVSETFKLWEVVVFFMICANSLYAIRVEFFYPVRMIGFILIIIFIFQFSQKRKVRTLNYFSGS